MDFSQIIGAELKKQAMSQILNKVGGDSKTANSIIEKALPTILGGLEKNTSDTEGVNALEKALASHTGETKIDIEDGKKILGHILGGAADSQSNAIANEVGVSAQQGKDVMGILSSLVMEKLGDEKAKGLDGAAIAKLLSGSSKSSNQMLGMFLDQDGDGDFDQQDAVKFGIKWFQQKFLGKK